MKCTNPQLLGLLAANSYAIPFSKNCPHLVEASLTPMTDSEQGSRVTTQSTGFKAGQLFEVTHASEPPHGMKLGLGDQQSGFPGTVLVLALKVMGNPSVTDKLGWLILLELRPPLAYEFLPLPWPVALTCLQTTPSIEHLPRKAGPRLCMWKTRPKSPASAPGSV